MRVRVRDKAEVVVSTCRVYTEYRGRQNRAEQEQEQVQLQEQEQGPPYLVPCNITSKQVQEVLSELSSSVRG